MRFIYGLLILTIIWSCAEENKVNFQKIEKITITPFYQDSMSVRAIFPLDENRVWFGGNLGKVGLIDHDTPKLASISYKDSLLQFRAIATTRESVFVLSIANPAILYKIGFDGIQATAIEQVYFEEHEKVFYDAIRFWDNTDGIAMGDPIDGCLSILITRDGGNNWTKLPCEQLPATAEGEAAYAASNSNIAIVNDKVWIVSGGMKSRVFYSGDRGNTWEVFDTPIISGGKMTGIYSVDFYDENTGIIFGGDWENKDNNTGNKAITQDGGKTWQLVSDGSGPGYRSSVRYVPNSEGQEIITVGSPGISYSYDGGNTWTELSDEGFFAIEFANDSTAFASGNNKISKLQFVRD